MKWERVYRDDVSKLKNRIIWSEDEFVLANEIWYLIPTFNSDLYDGKLCHVTHFVLNAALSHCYPITTEKNVPCECFVFAYLLCVNTNAWGTHKYACIGSFSHCYTLCIGLWAKHVVYGLVCWLCYKLTKWTTIDPIYKSRTICKIFLVDA